MAAAEAASSGPRMSVAGYDVWLPEPRLFLRKTASVVILTIALLPVITVKDGIPALIYIGALVVLHLIILGIYLYRVRFRDLAPDARSLIARAVALAVMSYLLLVVSKFDPDGPRSTLVLQLIGVMVFHTGLLAIITVRMQRRP